MTDKKLVPKLLVLVYQWWGPHWTDSRAVFYNGMIPHWALLKFMREFGWLEKSAWAQSQEETNLQL